MRILIVEDSFEIAAGIERILAIKFRDEIEKKLTVPTVESGINALSAFDPNVILFDVNLPDGSGFDILPHVRDETVVKICMSALPADKLINRVVQSDILSFIPKPFDAVDIENAVAKALHLVRERQQNVFLEKGLDAKHQAALEEVKHLRALVGEMQTSEQKKTEEKKTGQETAQEENHESAEGDSVQTIKALAEGILFCEARKNYVLVHLEQKQKQEQEREQKVLKMRITLTDIEKQLIPLGFTRVHKSFLVQMKKAVNFSEGTLYFAGGRKVSVAKRLHGKMKKAFAKPWKSVPLPLPAKVSE